MKRVVVEHAVQRYVQRHEPSLSIDEAREKLEGLFAVAGRMKAKSLNGQEQYKADSVIFIVKRDPGALVAVTVLPHREFVEPESDPMGGDSPPVVRPTWSEAAPAATRRRYLSERLTSTERELDRVRQHASLMDRNACLAKRALRLALHAIDVPEDKDAALRAIRELNAGFLSPEFKNHNRENWGLK